MLGKLVNGYRHVASVTREVANSYRDVAIITPGSCYKLAGVLPRLLGAVGNSYSGVLCQLVGWRYIYSGRLSKLLGVVMRCISSSYSRKGSLFLFLSFSDCSQCFEVYLFGAYVHSHCSGTSNSIHLFST